MNNLIKNFCLIPIILQFLCSCAITRAMWGGSADVGGMRIEGFFIDKEKNHVVLVNWMNPDEPHTNYSISDPTGKLLKAFELGQKNNAEFIVYLHGVESKGSEIYGQSLNLRFDLTKEIPISEENLIKKVAGNYYFNTKYAKGVNFTFSKFNGNTPFRNMITRYPSSQETFTNFCSETNKSPTCSPITKFATPWQGSIKNNFTTSDHALRIVATPFALVADILLTPLYIIGVIGMGVGGR